MEILLTLYRHFFEHEFKPRNYAIVVFDELVASPDQWRNRVLLPNSRGRTVKWVGVTFKQQNAGVHKDLH